MATALLTDIAARSAKAIPGRQHTIWDTALPGFGLRVGADVKAWTIDGRKGSAPYYDRAIPNNGIAGSTS